MWTKAKLVTILKSRTTALGAASLIGFASGASGYHFLLGRKLEQKYRLIADSEVLEAKLFYAKKFKGGEYADPSALVTEKYEAERAENEFSEPELVQTESALIEQASEILERHDYTKHSKPQQSQEEVAEVAQSIKKNIFDEYPVDDTTFDAEAEDAKRAGNEPYIIPIADYMSNASGFPQVVWTYYEGDDVMATELDIPIENYESRLGGANLKFGKASADPNIVYIRNENIEEEYEIHRSRGTFEDEVTAGFAHSEDYGVRKFRPDRD